MHRAVCFGSSNGDSIKAAGDSRHIQNRLQGPQARPGIIVAEQRKPRGRGTKLPLHDRVVSVKLVICWLDAAYFYCPGRDTTQREEGMQILAYIQLVSR